MTNTIQNALRRLRDDAAGKKAPDALEAKLLASYRAHYASRKRRRIWIPVAIAASLGIAVWGLSQRSAAPTPATSPILAKGVAKGSSNLEVSVAAHAPARNETPKIVKNHVAVKPKLRVRRLPTRQIAQALPQQMEEFFEIPYTPALADYDGGRVVRVNMPGASVRSLGLPVMSDRVQADLFVGDDGIARAIRVVSSSRAEFQKVRKQ